LNSHPRRFYKKGFAGFLTVVYSYIMTPKEYKATREKIGTQAAVAPLLDVNRVTLAKRESGAWEITKEAALALEALSNRPKSKRGD
tara:strand:+ start:475 stop:732 length:258 start_codon:yes stop_codon:yes gene_type:complete